MKIFKYSARSVESVWRRLTAASILLLLLGFGVVGSASALTVEEYCNLSRDLMALSVQEWQEKERVVNEKRDASKDDLYTDLKVVESSFRIAREQLYEDYATTNQEYLGFMSVNGKAIRSYLGRNPDLMNQINGFSAEVNNLADKVEFVMMEKQGGAQ